MASVSVIVPTYNRAGLIRETLESVLAQTWAGAEILVVDDGSEDGTRDALADLMGRITYCRIKHSGASAARNAGLEMARGWAVAFLDSDDVWDKRFLDKMTAALERAPQAGFAYCDYATFSEQGVIQSRSLLPDEKICGSLFARLLESDFISTGTLLIRRACLQEVGGFDRHLRVAHDWDLWLRLARRYEAEYVDEPLARIRFHSERLTQNLEAIYTDNLHILAKLRRDLGRDAGRFRPAIRKNTAQFHRALAGHLRRTRRPLPAFGHLFLAAAARLL